MNNTSDFGGIEDAKSNAGGVYVSPGLYLLRIKKCAKGETRKKRKFFVVEFETVESNNENRPVGGSQSWMVMLDNDAALGSIKDFFMALTGLPESKITSALAETAVSEENPFSGLYIKAEASNIVTRRGTDFTKVAWTHCAQS